MSLYSVSVALNLRKDEERRPRYTEAAFYVCAHQDDWQLFMGADAYNDIRSFDELKTEANGKKVVIIYTTAGNLNDDNDANTCDCQDARSRKKKPMPYWMVREQGARNSVHFAACKLSDRGTSIGAAAGAWVTINDHKVWRYEFMNVVSYFMRVKTGEYGKWRTDKNAHASTIDGATTYTTYADYVNTLRTVYATELDRDLTERKAVFHMPDTDEAINMNDHTDHLIAGNASMDALQQLATRGSTSFPAWLYIDYHTEKLPPNLADPGPQNEAGLTAVYCLALLDYNAWAEWGTSYQKWTTRNYYRVVSVGSGVR